MKRLTRLLIVGWIATALPGCALLDFLDQIEQRTEEELIREAPAELGVVDLAVQGILDTLMFSFDTLTRDETGPEQPVQTQPMAALQKAAGHFRPAQGGSEQQTIDCLDGGTLTLGRSAESLPDGSVRFTVRLEAADCTLPLDEASADSPAGDELPVPVVDAFVPNPVTAGSELTIVGAFFALDLSDETLDPPAIELLRIDNNGEILEQRDATSDVTSWDFGQIVMTVPEDVTTGTWLVGIFNGLFYAPSQVALGVGTAPVELTAPPLPDAANQIAQIVEWLDGFVEISVEGTALETSNPDISRFSLDADLAHEIRAGEEVWRHDAWEGLAMHGAADNSGRLGIQVEGTLRSREADSRWFIAYENTDLAMQMDQDYVPRFLDIDGRITMQGGSLSGGDCIDGTWRISTLLPIEIADSDACPTQGSVMVNDFEYTFVGPTQVEVRSGPRVVTVHCADAVGEFAACMGMLMHDEEPLSSTEPGSDTMHDGMP